MNVPPNLTKARTKPLPRHVLAALAGPSIPLSALSLPLVVYLPGYYSGELGLSLALVGAIFMVVRLLDIAFDPLIGGVMDRTRTRIGRYRPWLLAGAPMVMLAMGMLFMASPGVGPWHLAIWLVLAYAGWSILSLSQLALASNVSPDYNERSRIYGWWQVAFFIGMIGAMLLPKLVQMQGFTSPSASMKAMAWLVIALAPLMSVIAFVVVRERPIAISEHRSSLREYFGLMRNRTVQKLLACEGLLGLAGGATSTLALFFFTRSKGLEPADVGLLFIGHFLVGLACTPLWSWLANRVGKHRALAFASLAYATLMSLFFLVPVGNFALVALIQCASGVGYGAISLLPRAMMADISDEERLDSRADRTGLLFALLIGTWKIGQALSVGLMFLALSLIGFDPAPTAANPADAVLGLNLLFIGLPVLLSLAAAWVAFTYPLTAERHTEIRRQLDVRDAAVSG